MGILADFIGGIGKGVGDTVTGVVNMLGSGVASARDLGAMMAGNYDPNNSEDLKWKKFMTGADNAKDAYAKSAGQALNAANNLGDVVIGLASGGAGNAALQGMGKALSTGAGAVATNALQGVVGGIADEFQENGANASFDSGAQRAVTGGLSGFMSGLVNNKINNSSNKMLNNKFVNSNFGRGAIAGAVGGATSGGVSTALNGGGLLDIVGNSLEGGVMGAAQGGASGYLMGKAHEAGENMVNKIWTAEQNQSFQNAVNNPSKVNSPIYLGEVSQDTVNNIAQAYKNAGVDLDMNPDALSAIKVDNGKLYLTQDGAKHLNERRIQNDQMTAKEVRQTMRNATDNGVVSQNLSNAGNVTMGAQNPKQTRSLDIAHIGVNEDGSLNLQTTYRSRGGQTYNEIKSTLGGSTIQPSTNAYEGEGLPARTSALQGVDDNISQNRQDVNVPESHEGKNLRLKSAEALLDQYGTIDKPMARSANAIENVQKVADAGFTKPGDVEDIISKVTGADGKVSKLTQKLVNTAQPVDTVTDISRLVDEQIALNGLADTTEGKAVKNTIEAQLNRLESRRNGSITGLDNPEDVYDVIKALESRSADLKGKSGNNYRLTTPERTDQARVIDNIADVLKDRLYGGADMSKIMTPEVAVELKSYAPKNEKWASYVDNTIMKSRDIGELRSTMAPFVNMGKVIENQYMNYGTYGSQMSQTAKNARSLAGKVSDIPVIGKIAAPLAEMTLGSNAADRTRAKLYSKLADQADQRAVAKNPDTQVSNNAMMGDTTQRTTTNLPLDDIGRLEGALVENMVSDNEKAGAEAQYLEQAQMMGQGAQEKISPVFQIADGQLVDITQTEMAMASALEKGDMASYNELGQIYQALSNAQANGVSGTVGTLDALRQENQITNWLAQCQQAMMNAMQAGDYKAFTQYAAMAESVQKLFGSSQQNPYENWSSSDRKSFIEIQNGLNDIDNLESLYNQAGGGQGKLGGLIANIGSNVGMNDAVATYNTQMNSLGAAIVKNLINLGGTEYDAKRYVEALPQIDDSPEKAQQKLAALRSAYQKRLEVLQKMNG